MIKFLQTRFELQSTASSYFLYLKFRFNKFNNSVDTLRNLFTLIHFAKAFFHLFDTGIIPKG